MRHYEILFMVHPDYSQEVPQTIDRYRQIFVDSGCSVDRVEDWGRRALAYPIRKLQKAHYVLMNVTASQGAVDQLLQAFRFNDNVLRYLLTRASTAITGPSIVMESARREAEAEEREKRSEGAKRDGQAAARNDASAAPAQSGGEE